MDVKAWTYEEFPEFTEIPEDVVSIGTTGDETTVFYVNDVEYRKVDGVALQLQILIPTSRNEMRDPYGLEAYTREQLDALRLPCVAYVKGSAWGEQMMYKTLPNLIALAKRGFVVAEIQYRHSGIASFPAQAEDTMNAIRFLREHAGEYFIDPKNVIVAGDSSGGHTAFFSQILAERQGDASAKTKGLISLYGAVSAMYDDGFPTTLNHHLPDSPEGMLMGRKNLYEHPKLREEMSVECNLTKDMDFPPILMIHGTKDRTVNTKLSVILHEKCKELGMDAKLCLIRGADHGGAEFWTKEVVDVMEEFIRRVIS